MDHDGEPEIEVIDQVKVRKDSLPLLCVCVCTVIYSSIVGQPRLVSYYQEQYHIE